MCWESCTRKTRKTNQRIFGEKPAWKLFWRNKNQLVQKWIAMPREETRKPYQKPVSSNKQIRVLSANIFSKWWVLIHRLEKFTIHCRPNELKFNQVTKLRMFNSKWILHKHWTSFSQKLWWSTTKNFSHPMQFKNDGHVSNKYCWSSKNR